MASWRTHWAHNAGFRTSDFNEAAGLTIGCFLLGTKRRVYGIVFQNRHGGQHVFPAALDLAYRVVDMGIELRSFKGVRRDP